MNTIETQQPQPQSLSPKKVSSVPQGKVEEIFASA